MRWIFLFFTILCLSCNGKKSGVYTINIDTQKERLRLGDTISVSVRQNSEKIGDFSLQINGKELIKTEKGYIFYSERVGEQSLDLVQNSQVVYRQKVMIYAPKPPKIYTYTIVNTFDHDPKAYTQGLEFQNDTLYESTGFYGASSLRKVDFKTGKVLQKIDLERIYFGEGITIFDDKIIQLTWQNNKGFVYQLSSFEKIKEFNYGESKEGWGLCNDGQKIFKSDGSDRIWILNAETLSEEDFIQICSDKASFGKANELEYANGLIFANTYTKDGIMIIDPKTGVLEGIVNMSGLKEKVTQYADIDVLNGIAYHPKRQTFFVTGKHWDKLFEVKFVEKKITKNP